MSASDLDQLIEQAAALGQVAAGTDRRVLAARGADPRLLAVAHRQEKARTARWTEAEEDYVRAQWASRSIQEIAETLGRSFTAVKVHTLRDMHLPRRPAGNRPDVLTTNALAHGLDVDVHAVSGWLKRGLLPYHLMPCRGGRAIHLLYRRDVVRFVANPASWIYFKPESINRPTYREHLRRPLKRLDRDWFEKLRALTLRRKALWGDAWWTTGQVAAYHHVSWSQVNALIREGQLPGVRYQNWNVLRSDALALPPARGYGKGRKGVARTFTSPAEDAFLVLAWAAGLSLPAISAMGGRNTKQIPYRIHSLASQGKLPWIVQHHQLPVRFNRRGEMLADWKALHHRFPRVWRTLRRFRHGDELKQNERLLVRAVLQAWARFFARNAEQRAIVKSLTSLCRRSTDQLRRLLRRLQATGIDPYRKLPALPRKETKHVQAH